MQPAERRKRDKRDAGSLIACAVLSRTIPSARYPGGGGGAGEWRGGEGGGGGAVAVGADARCSHRFDFVSSMLAAYVHGFVGQDRAGSRDVFEQRGA
jgi:hypothetical protein